MPDGAEIEYLIDGLNRRVGKKVNGMLVKRWLYQDQINPVAELDGSGDVTVRFVYGSRANSPELMIKNGITYRIISDHLGSPRQIINTTNGQIAQQIEYDEFGAVTLDTNPGFQSLGFAGGLYDEDTRLVRFGARDYDAGIGRWASKEYRRFTDGENLYLYVSGDPLNSIDLSGFAGEPVTPLPKGPAGNQGVIFEPPGGSQTRPSRGERVGNRLLSELLKQLTNNLFKVDPISGLIRPARVAPFLLIFKLNSTAECQTLTCDLDGDGFVDDKFLEGLCAPGFN